MSKADVAFERSIIKMPVDGPAPNNTLVFIRAWLPASGSDGVIAPGGITSFFEGQDDTDTSRGRLTLPSLYAIDQFAHANYDSYKANTQISIAAYLAAVDLTDDDTFTAAVDEVTAEIDRDGRVQITATIAEGEGGATELTMAIFFSAYILTYEPRTEVP
jgi:hypothetical protein